MRSCTLSTQQCAGTQVPDKWQFLSFIANLYQNAGNKKKKERRDQNSTGVKGWK